MAKTNRQKKKEGLEIGAEINPREKEVNTIDDIADDIENGIDTISVRHGRRYGTVPECLSPGCKEVKANNFYLSFNPLHAKYGVYPYCKQCMMKIYNANYNASFNFIKKQHRNQYTALWYTCMAFNIGYVHEIAISAHDMETHTFAAYMSQYNPRVKRSDLPVSFDESRDNLLKLNEVRRDEVDMLKEYDCETLEWDEEDRRNKEDVVRIYGYDVFEAYLTEDKKKMYNVLIDYLDEATIADNFKKSAVVQIVKNMNYIEKIDSEMINMDIISKTADLKRLTDAKNSLMHSNLQVAKDNGISLNHSSNKSKGAGTLSGILKDLQEKGIVESDVNLFDIKTCEGIKKVADVSNRSILDQLMLDENSYTEMIKEQRGLIEKYRVKSEELEEELRLLKVKYSK